MGLTNFRLFSNDTSNGRRLFCIMYLMLLFTVGSEENCHAAETKNFVIYQSIKIKEVDKFFVEGVDLTDCKFRWIFQYRKIENELFVLGSSEDEGMRLMKINIVDKKVILIAEYPEIRNWNDLLEAKFHLLLFEKTKKLEPIIFVEFIGGNSARNIDERETHLDVLCSISNNQYQSISSEKLSENSIVYIIQTEPEDKYLYLTVNNAQRNDYVISPAKLEVIKIQFSDCNWDGYPDIVIWKTVNFSRLIRDKDKNDFLYDHEEVLVMYYQPQEMKFSKPTPIKWQQ